MSIHGILISDCYTTVAFRDDGLLDVLLKRHNETWPVAHERGLTPAEAERLMVAHGFPVLVKAPGLVMTS